jgi:predicted DNA-binding helix-hairpin-helix protein
VPVHELVHEGGLWADRMSVNLEIPTEPNLKLLAPEKNYPAIFSPMTQIRNEILASKEEVRKFRKAPRFAPAGQSTQMIIGATPETDRQIILLSSGLYKTQNLKRVYFSGYLPVNEYDKRTSGAHPATAGTRKPVVPKRLADAVLPLQSRGNSYRRPAFS